MIQHKTKTSTEMEMKGALGNVIWCHNYQFGWHA